MLVLSTELTSRLHNTLARCRQFDSSQGLQSIFVEKRISPWRDSIPEGSTRNERIDNLINALYNQANAQGENALVLFLQVLANEYPPDDALNRELSALAQALAETQLLNQELDAPPKVSETDSKTQRSDRKVIGIVVLAVILVIIIMTLAIGYPRLFRSTPTPTLAPTPTLTPAPTVTLTPPNCPGKGTTDEEIVLDLIEQERRAVLEEDIDMITSIFAAEVIIQDVRNGLIWTSAAKHYTEMFHNQDHCSITHTNYTFKPEGDGIKVTCLSSGTWGAEGQRCTDPFKNDLNTWRFRKDEDGCWRIVEFSFNDPQE